MITDSEPVRAGVFIGVDRSGDLARLTAAAEGARRMHAWALSQGMRDGSHAKVITDGDGGKVSPDRVYDAIEQIVDGAGADQMIVYFAGHGVNINRNEHWLLTDAPRRSSAAINVSGSADLARYCGVRHVVFISDACRIAADGIQAQNVRGQDIFPNDGPGGTMMPVDQFFACELGRAAHEIRDPAEATSNYRAVYTDAVLDAVTGQRADVLDPAADPDDKAWYVHPLRLKDYLRAEIPERVRRMGHQHRVHQWPDALVIADSPWIARIPPTERPPSRAVTPDASRTFVPHPGALASRLVEAAETDTLGPEIWRVRLSGDARAAELADAIERARTPVDDERFDSRCGVKAVGTTIEGFLAVSASGALDTTNRSLRLKPDGTAGFSVVLRFGNGLGTVLPALPEYVTTVTVDEDEVTDVAIEPCPGTPRRPDYPARRMRDLRAIAAACSRYDRFRLSGDAASSFLRQIHGPAGPDPALAVHAAYALYEQQRVRPIRELGVPLFDIALLGRSLTGQAVDQDTGVLPFVPMMSRGWALLGAGQVRLHRAIDGLDRTLRESVWSLYDETGVELLEKALRSGGVR